MLKWYFTVQQCSCRLIPVITALRLLSFACSTTKPTFCTSIWKGSLSPEHQRLTLESFCYCLCSTWHSWTETLHWELTWISFNPAALQQRCSFLLLAQTQYLSSCSDSVFSLTLFRACHCSLIDAVEIVGPHQCGTFLLAALTLCLLSDGSW